MRRVTVCPSRSNAPSKSGSQARSTREEDTGGLRRSLVGEHQLPHRSGLILELGGHHRTLCLVGDGGEDRVTAPGPDRFAVGAALLADGRSVHRPNRDRRRLPTALGDQNQPYAVASEVIGGGQDVGQRIVRFAVGEKDQDAIRHIGAAEQEVAPLLERAGQCGPAHAGDVGIEAVYQELQRARVHRERRHDEALAGKGDQADAVAREILNQPTRFPLRPAQSGRLDVLGKHRARHVHRDHQVQGFRLDRDHPPPPPGTGERHAGRKGREPQQDPPPAPRTPREPGQVSRPPGRVGDARPVRPDRQPRDQERRNRSGIEQ